MITKMFLLLNNIIWILVWETAEQEQNSSVFPHQKAWVMFSIMFSRLKLHLVDPDHKGADRRRVIYTYELKSFFVFFCFTLALLNMC